MVGINGEAKRASERERGREKEERIAMHQDVCACAILAPVFSAYRALIQFDGQSRNGCSREKMFPCCSFELP